MTYDARIGKVMIASPGDVASERQIIKDVIYEWNAIFSEERHLVLMPTGWDTHATPSMGDRPQALINKQVLAGCDLLVAVFWTRIGSPTGVAPSGTVEEIEEHLRASRPAMLYFSSVPVRVDSVDEQQYSALREFKAHCQERGLVETYDSIQEFQKKFYRQLTQTIIQLYPVGDTETPEIKTLSNPAPQMGEAAKELLLEAAKDQSGTILHFRSFGGISIQTNGRTFDMSSPRAEALWEAALNELMALDLIQDPGYKGEIYQLTHKGYQVVDKLGGTG